MASFTFLKQLTRQGKASPAVRSRGRRTRMRFRPRIEGFEDRLLLSTWLVQNRYDGDCTAGLRTLRCALSQAQGGDQIIFDRNLLAGATIFLAYGELVVSHSVTITGLGANQLSISGNNGSSRVFRITPNSTVSISGLTIRDGGSVEQGGGIYNAGTLTLQASTVRNNTLKTDFEARTLGTSGLIRNQGGGIDNAGTLTLIDSTVSNNTVRARLVNYYLAGPSILGNLVRWGDNGVGQGGGIYSAGNLYVIRSTVSNNQVVGPNAPDCDNTLFGIGIFGEGHGGGRGFFACSSPAGGPGQGGGIYQADGNVQIFDSTLSDNGAFGGSGGWGRTGPQVIPTDLPRYPGFAGGNGGAGQGGALYVAHGALLLQSTTVANNAVAGGPGGHGGDAEFTGLTSDTRRHTGDGGVGGLAQGGGLYNAFGSATIVNSTFSSNRGQGGQGAPIGVFGDIGCNRGRELGDLWERQETFVSYCESVDYPGYPEVRALYGVPGAGGNAQGGALYNASGTGTIVHSTFSGNQIQGGQGGPSTYDDAYGSACRLRGPGCPADISGRSGDASGGGLFLSSSSLLYIQNTILAGNTAYALLAGPRPGQDQFGTVISHGHNLVGNAAWAGGYYELLADQLNVDPRLGPLQDNGGPTWTMAPLPGSPALHAGEIRGAPATDQRGLPRIVDGSIEIGAVEIQQPNTTTVSASPSSPLSGQTVTFTATVLYDGRPANSGTVLFREGATTLAGPVPVVGGRASFRTSALSIGDHTITTVWSGTGSSGSTSLTVRGFPTTTVLATSANPAAFNQRVTFTATVSGPPDRGTPTGSVTFRSGPFELGMVPLSGGQASVTYQYGGRPQAYSERVTATYHATLPFLDSTAQLDENLIPQIVTTTVVTPSANPVEENHPVAFTVTVSGPPGTSAPTGQVRLYGQGFVSGAIIANLSGGRATFAPPSWSGGYPEGSYFVQAEYLPDVPIFQSSSKVVTEIVTGPFTTTTAVTSSAEAVRVGEAATFTAVVSTRPGMGTPTGSVTFRDGSTVLATVPLTGTTATLTRTLAQGDHTITATYNGSNDPSHPFRPSTGQTYQFVGQFYSRAVLTASTTTSVYGQEVTFTLAATIDGRPMNRGAVALYSSAGQWYSQLNNGQAVIRISSLPAGVYWITAFVNSIYPTIAGADSNGVPLTVTPAPLTVTVNDAARTYGDANPTFTGTFTGLRNDDPITFGAATAATPASPVGAYDLVPALRDPSNRLHNYQVTQRYGTLTVTPAPLTVRATDASRTYGAANPEFTATFSGFVLGQTLATSGVRGSPSFSTPATPSSPVGSYAITPSGLTSGNYQIRFANGTLSVTRAPLTITASDASKVYGQANAAFSAHYLGLVLGERPGVLSGSLSWNTPATNTSPVGSYAITPSGLTSSNYQITFANGSLSVTRAPLTVTADNQSRVYGAANPVFTVTFTGFVLGQTLATSGVTGNPTLTTTATTGSNAGTYAITVTQGSLAAANYSFTLVNGTLTVNPAATRLALDSSANPVVYGHAVTFTATVSVVPPGAGTPHGTVRFYHYYVGLLGEAPVINGQATFITTALPAGTTRLNAGFYPEANYLFSDSNILDQRVTPAPLTVTADNKARPYGAANPPFTATVSGFQNGETLATSGVTGTPSLATAATATSPVGSYPITASQGSLAAANYSFTFVSGALTVTKAPLTIAADNKTKVYGAALPALTASYSGFVNGDTPASLTTPVSLATPASPGSPVGSYPITAAGATSPNYTITFTTGTLTVTKALLTIAADNKTKVYGAALPALTASYQGFVNGDTPASLTTPVSLATTATPGSPAGSYPITASGATSPNYTITFNSGTLMVTKAPLAITADSKTKVYGAALPALTASYQGFVNGDTPASLTTPVSLATSATPGSPAGAYPITAAGATSPNYTITFASGTLTVTKAPLTITATDASKVYGQANPAFTARYSGFVLGETPAVLGGTLSFTTPATDASPVGSYLVTPGGLTSGNYQITFANGTLSVTRAPLTVTANDASKVYGQANPAFTARYQGFVLGEGPGVLRGTLSFTTPATAASSVGTYAITPTGLTSSNYQITFADGAFTVTRAPLSVHVDNLSRVYGDPNPTLTGNLSGLQNNDLITATYSTTATPRSPAGLYAIVPTLFDPTGRLANYSLSSNIGVLTVTQAPLTITADNKIKVAGDPLPTLTASYQGFVNGDTPASLTTPVTLTTTATPTSPAGTYPITAAGATSPNYTMTFRNGTLTILPAAASHLVVSGYPSPTTAGDSHSFTITAMDAFGNVATDYAGTVSFSSSDGQAVLPDTYTFTAADHGLHTFAATLATAGRASLTATDTMSASLTGTQADIVVNPAAADHFQIDTVESSTAGQAFDLTITALDPYGNIDTHYAGTVTFTSTDDLAMLPTDYSFTAQDQGVHTFPSGTTLFRAGTQTLTATDLNTGLVVGSVDIAVSAAAADHFQVLVPDTVQAGQAFDVTVLALDPYGNVDTNYLGTIHFSSQDPHPGVVLPDDYAFTAADAGMVTFAGGVTLQTVGDWDVTVTDADAGLTGSATVTVLDGGGGPSRAAAGRSARSTPAGSVDAIPSARDIAPVQGQEWQPRVPADQDWFFVELAHKEQQVARWI